MQPSHCLTTANGQGHQLLHASRECTIGPRRRVERAEPLPGIRLGAPQIASRLAEFVDDVAEMCHNPSIDATVTNGQGPRSLLRKASLRRRSARWPAPGRIGVAVGVGGCACPVGLPLGLGGEGPASAVVGEAEVDQSPEVDRGGAECEPDAVPGDAPVGDASARSDQPGEGAFDHGSPSPVVVYEAGHLS